MINFFGANTKFGIRKALGDAWNTGRARVDLRMECHNYLNSALKYPNK